MSYYENRNDWLLSTEEVFLKDCTHDWFQASGPGGQKRNRKYSGIRLKHIPTGIYVEEVHSRSQNDNRHNAVKKLKLKIAIEADGPEIELFRENTSVSNKEFPLCAAKVFDTLKKAGFSVSDTAKALGVSTAKIIKFFSKSEYLWRELNQKREKFGLKHLKS
jgi:hypothetical protein